MSLFCLTLRSPVIHLIFLSISIDFNPVSFSRLLTAEIQVSFCLPLFPLPVICPCVLPCVLSLSVSPVIRAPFLHFSHSLLIPLFTPFPTAREHCMPIFCPRLCNLITSRLVQCHASLLLLLLHMKKKK